MIIIGIDNNENKCKIQVGVGVGQHPAIETVDIPGELFAKGDYPDILDKALTAYIADKGAFTPESVVLVVPDRLVTMDTILLPTMAKRTMGDTFRTEYHNLYKNHDELLSHATVINANKKTTEYLLTLIRKDTVQRFREVLAGHGLKMDKVVSAAAARCEALTDQHARLHRDTYLFLDVLSSSSQMVLYDKGRLFGYATLPFGLDALVDDRVISEYDLYRNDIADLAVINAREKAKAAKLTMAHDEDMNADILAAPAEGATALSKQEIMDMAQAMQEEEDAAAAEAEAAARAADDQDDDDADVEAEETAPVEVQTTPQGKRYVKKARKLPVFMQRPIPESPNGIVSENFRAFQVRLLNYVRQCNLTDSLPKPSYIVLNLPERYEFLVQMLNTQEDNGVNFRLLCTDGHSPILNDLEMFGASKMGPRSRNPVF